MVQSGMPEMETIKCATIKAAQMLKVDEEFGSIEEGKWADIVAVPGNPLDDISLMQKVNFLMKDGAVYK